MEPLRRITRVTFLQAVARSRLIRIAAFLLGGVALAFLAAGLGQKIGFVALIVVFVVVIVALQALQYLFASESRRRALDEDSRLARSHWSYEYRGLAWAGLGVVIGNLVAFWSSGRDPTGGVVAGGTCALVGIVAHVVAAKRQAG